MIRLIASDVVGTLLPDSEKQVDAPVLEQLNRLTRKGIFFCPVSGRQFTSLQRLFKHLPSQMYYICENGAAIFGPGDPAVLLDVTVIDRESGLGLSRQILNEPDFELIVSGVNTTYLCPKHLDLEPYIRYQLGNNTEIVSTPEDIPEEFLKISAYCREGGRTAEKRLAPIWKDKFRIAVAGKNWLDFTTTDKGSGLRKLCAILNIGLDEVMAFGDNDNDLSMLETVGHPYIVENASQVLKDRFPGRCCRVEEILKEIL